jgi:IS30 family transposase
VHKDHDIDGTVTIYGWIYRDTAAGGGLQKFLRQSHRRRRKRRAREDGRGQLPDRRMIDEIAAGKSQDDHF